MSADGGPTKPKKRERVGPPLEIMRAVANALRLRPAEPSEYILLMDCFEWIERLQAEVDSKDASIERIKRLKFSPGESARQVLGETRDNRPANADPASGVAPKSDANAAGEAAKSCSGTSDAADKGNNAAAKGPCSTKRKRRPPKDGGHGRRPADSYRADKEEPLHHPHLRPGDRCPACRKGTLYVPRPKVRVHIKAQAPLTATKYKIYELRCRLCGEIHSFEIPIEARRKYHESAVAQIAYQLYRVGVPMHTNMRVQENAGVPMPVGTQWELLDYWEPFIRPAVQELIRQAANAPQLYNDDTPNKILNLYEQERRILLGPDAGDRTGVFTSAIVAETADGYTITLYFTGPRHAGENLRIVLRFRAAGLPPPRLMCDALPHNVPNGFELIVSNCCAHGRRQFVDVYKKFEEEVRIVIHFFSFIYAVDDEARRLNLSPEERLRLHRQKSRPVMIQMALWMRDLLRDRKVEPNSGLGKAIRYLRKHWIKLTRFYRVIGAKLDNNITERAIKTAIRHRKNSLFHRTLRGAQVGDTFTTLIVTAERCGIEPVRYLTALMQNADALACDPADWMPWSYQKTLERRKLTAGARGTHTSGRCSAPSA
jgi:transposase